MIVKIINMGGSKAIILPKRMCDFYNMKIDDIFNIDDMNNKNIHLTKIEKEGVI